MTLPIYELKISEDINNEAEVSYIALVDEPAIKKDFLAFKDEFVSPSKGEHKIDFLPRCIAYVIKEGKDSDQAVAICNSMWTEHFAVGNNCPIATQDISTNLKDRQNAIDVANYGPLNPNLPSDEYWIRKAKQFNATIEEAKQSICGNCSFFNVSQKIKDCIANGIGNELDPYNVIDAGDLGYCEAFDFKCAAKRTCDAWVVGGPVTMAANKISFDYDDTLSTERGKTLAKRLIAEGNTIYIISARDSKDGMLSTASDLGIPESRVYATGSNSAKVQKVKDLGIDKHYDNNADVIAQLDGIGSKFMESHSFAIVNEEQRIISGPLMIADELIYRNNEKFGEHYVKFSAETIKQIAIKFAKKKFQNHVNLMHNSDQKVDDVTMFESFIVDKNRGIMPMAEFKEVADGSWFGSFYVENDEVWSEVKKGTYRGFSVEGLFDYVEPITAEQNALNQISKLLNELITD
jgi:hypothetical protein